MLLDIKPANHKSNHEPKLINSFSRSLTLFGNKIRSLPSLLPPLLLPLISLPLPSLLPLNLRHKPLILLLIRSITFLLNPQTLPRNTLRILPQLSNRALLLPLILFLQLRGFGALFVGVVVSVGVVRFFEFGDAGFDGERAMVVQFEGSTGEVGLGKEEGELLG